MVLTELPKLGVISLYLMLWNTIRYQPKNPFPNFKEYMIHLYNTVLKDTMWFNSKAVDPMFISLFNFMGVYVFLAGALLLPDAADKSDSQKKSRLHPFPFVLGSMFGGAFVLLPYVIARDNEVTESKMFGYYTLASSVGFAAYGLLLGNWSKLYEMFKTDIFTYVMTFDFLTLTLTTPYMVKLDSKRRFPKGREFTTMESIVYSIPLIGPSLWLIQRP